MTTDRTHFAAQITSTRYRAGCLAAERFRPPEPEERATRRDEPTTRLRAKVTCEDCSAWLVWADSFSPPVKRKE